MITGFLDRCDQRLGSGIAIDLGRLDADVGGDHARYRFQRFTGTGGAVHAAQAAQLQFGIRPLRYGSLVTGGDHAVDQRLARRIAGDFGVMDVDLCLFDIVAAFQGFFHPLRAVHAG
ncbi:hypothetical protein D3C79_484500 [compost metagenome]